MEDQELKKALEKSAVYLYPCQQSRLVGLSGCDRLQGCQGILRWKAIRMAGMVLPPGGIPEIFVHHGYAYAAPDGA